jgi:hypothetical protein
MTRQTGTQFVQDANSPIDPNQLGTPEDDGSVVIDIGPDEEIVDNPEPTPPVDEGYKQKYEELSSQFDSFKSEMEKKFNNVNQLAPVEPVAPQARTVDLPELQLGDIYGEPEKIQENLQNYIQGIVPQIQESAIDKFKQTPEFQALTMDYWNDKHNREVASLKSKYGERFTYDNDPDPYVQLVHQGKTLTEAHMILDYQRQEKQRLDEELQAQAEADKRRTMGIPAGQPIRQNYKPENQVRLSSQQQWAAEKMFTELPKAEAHKKYAESLKNILDNKGR